MATLGTFVAGQVLTAAELNDIGTWQTFNTTWGADGTAPSLGNGTLNCRYVEINKLVIAQYELRMGSTTTFGTSSYTFTYPVTASTAGFFAYADIGSGRAFDLNVALVYNVHPIVNNGNTTNFTLVRDGTSNRIGQTVPFTWANGDELSFTIVYKAA